ncbi:MAG TPA: polysaccharide deacetylase family protein [Candidatus Binataceae bacterium]|nr:polysaccharide deacetylase family protein [Candidatus Binataceae bacterium]
MEVALKIDVDTHQGLGIGVPRLAAMLEREGVAASFFISMGPDNSGRAIVRVLRNRGFLKKMFRTRAVAMYGWRTVLSGTILPARPIALAYPAVMRDLRTRGFELGVHGYDHVRWQDQIDAIGDSGVRAELHDAFEAFRAITGESARAFAAPGWRTNDAAARALEKAKIDYRSDTRGRGPYRCAIGDQILATLEIPTTTPTLDEVMGRPELPDAAAVMRYYLDEFKPDTLNVHTIHAETEGMGQLESFSVMIRALKERGAKFVAMREVAARINRAELPVCEIVRIELPGRAGWVAAQGPDRSVGQ